jgi:hypothetical protein
MSFKDLGNKDAAPHVDTPAQAEARAQAVADAKAKADAKSAKNATRRDAKAQQGPLRLVPAPADGTGEPTKP